MFVQTARTNLTECVRGTSSATGLIKAGRFSIGKTTPEKKNIGEIKPVK